MSVQEALASCRKAYIDARRMIQMPVDQEILGQFDAVAKYLRAGATYEATAEELFPG